MRLVLHGQRLDRHASFPDHPHHRWRHDRLGPWGVATGDFNADGKTDIAVASSGTASVNVLLGNGDATFVKTVYATSTTPRAIAVGDLNGDARLDIVTANYSSAQVSVLLGNGDGTLQATA